MIRPLHDTRPTCGCISGRQNKAYYHEARPHQAKDNDLLAPAEEAEKAEEPDVVRLSDIRSTKRLGGLLKPCYRKAGLPFLLAFDHAVWQRLLQPLHTFVGHTGVANIQPLEVGQPFKSS